jgi:hypothetical protein
LSSLARLFRNRDDEVQLSTMVKDRSGISEGQAKSEVQAWMQGKQF